MPLVIMAANKQIVIVFVDNQCIDKHIDIIRDNLIMSQGTHSSNFNLILLMENTVTLQMESGEDLHQLGQIEYGVQHNDTEHI